MPKCSKLLLPHDSRWPKSELRFGKSSRSMPIGLAVFLARLGTFRYAEGSTAMYWPIVDEALGARSLTQRVRTDLGKHFERIVQRYGLLRLPSNVRAHRYLSLILLHGGVPAGCLSSYFEQVWPRASSSQSGHEAIEAVLSSARARLHLNKPVVRFLEHGGNAAADWVERTLDLAQDSAEVWADLSDSAAAERAREAGLGSHVGLAFRDWVQQQAGQSGGKRAVLSGRTWKRPELIFDTATCSPVVLLPRQKLFGADAECSWVVEEGRARTFDAPAWNRSTEATTDERRHAVARPQQTYAVSWRSMEGQKRWEIAGVTEVDPLLVFFARDGKRVDTASGLPRDDLWIVRPSQNELEGEGARLVDDSVALDAGWSGYMAERWDLSACPGDGAVTIGDLRLALRIEGDPRPFLVTRPISLTEQSGVPVFRSWPNLRIPRVRSTETLDAWTMKWKTDASSGVVDLSLVTVEESPRWWTLDTELLGLPARAPVSLRLRGPLGRGATTQLAVWNGLSIDGEERMVTTDAPAVFSVSVPDGVSVQRVEDGKWDETASRISVRGREVSLYLNDGAAVGVVTVQVPRLAAHLYDGAVEAPSSALSKPGALRVEDDWLRHASLPCVAFFSGDFAADVELLSVAFPDGTEVACEAAHRGCSFRLGEIVQAQAAGRSTQAHLVAKVGYDLVRVGTWHREMGLSDLEVAAIEDPSGCMLLFSWSSGRLIGDVQAFLWPQWTPWDAPQHVSVEPMGDYAAKTQAVMVAPGAYVVQLVSVDPWSPAPSRRPALDSPSVAHAEVGSAAARMIRIQKAEGVQGRVMRVLATDTPSERTILWNQACSEATIDDLPLLMDVAGLEAGDDLWLRLQKAGADRRFERAEHIAEADWPAAVRVFDAAMPEARAAYLIVLGALDAPLGKWSSAWEPVSWCGTTPSSPDLERWAERLGLIDSEHAGPAAETADEEVEQPDRSVSWMELVARRRDFGDAAHDQMSTLPPQQLRAISGFLGLVPGGALGSEAQQVGYMRWLLQRSVRQENSDALGDATHELVRCLATVHAMNPERFGAAFHAVRGRLHQKARAGQADEWLNAPFAIGALAFLLRTQAVSPDVRVAMGFNQAWFRLTALHALQAAPDLFAHDLCWMHLELSSPDVHS